MLSGSLRLSLLQLRCFERNKLNKELDFHCNLHMKGYKNKEFSMHLQGVLNYHYQNDKCLVVNNAKTSFYL